MSGRTRTYRPGFFARFLPSGRWKLTLNHSTPGMVRLVSSGTIDMPCIDVTAISVSKALLWHCVEVRSSRRVDSLACLGEQAAVQLAADLYGFVNAHLFDLVASESGRLSEVDARLRTITEHQRQYLAHARFYRSFSAQERVFERILRACAEQGGKILTVHSVRAVGKVLGHVENILPPDRRRVVLHWFTGTPAEARRAIALGCYFSINGEMLRSPKHRQLVESLPLDRLLTETDGPFVERDGKPLRPRDIGETVAELAKVRSCSVKALENTILENLRRLVSA